MPDWKVLRLASTDDAPEAAAVMARWNDFLTAANAYVEARNRKTRSPEGTSDT